MTDLTLAGLVALGWSEQPWDLCWLECDQPGHARRVGDNLTCLCLVHASELEAGRFHGDYGGAPLPAFTMNTAWPWVSVADIDGPIPGVTG